MSNSRELVKEGEYLSLAFLAVHARIALDAIIHKEEFREPHKEYLEKASDFLSKVISGAVFMESGIPPSDFDHEHSLGFLGYAVQGDPFEKMIGNELVSVFFQKMKELFTRAAEGRIEEQDIIRLKEGSNFFELIYRRMIRELNLTTPFPIG